MVQIKDSRIHPPYSAFMMLTCNLRLPDFQRIQGKHRPTECRYDSIDDTNPQNFIAAKTANTSEGKQTRFSLQGSCSQETRMKNKLNAEQKWINLEIKEKLKEWT